MSPVTRRTFLTSVAAVVPAASTLAGAAVRPLLQHGLDAPVLIDRIEILRSGPNTFVRTTAKDGASGVTITNGREYLVPLMKERIIPFFLGKDARDVDSLVDRVYRTHQSNYKLAGLAFWTPVSWIEISVLDLLGRRAGKAIAEMLGGVRRREFPVYVSSLRRDTTPEQEAERFEKGLAETGARGVKFKVGGRMSLNEDASPGRTGRIVPHLRKALGENVTLYADANGSYDSAHGIEVGRLLEAHDVAIFEEPCPFDEYEETKAVADALSLTVAGGEQDTSEARFRWIAKHRGLDLLQPDLMYNGGLLRTMRVARMAAEAGLAGVAPHNPQTGARQAHFLQFAAAVPNLHGLQEWRLDSRGEEPWCSPQIRVRDGRMRLPDGPGLGVAFDPDVLARAEPL